MKNNKKKQNKVKDDGSNIMKRTEAAVHYCNATNDDECKFAAFMAIFHNKKLSRSEVREMMGR